MRLSLQEACKRYVMKAQGNGIKRPVDDGPGREMRQYLFVVLRLLQPTQIRLGHRNAFVRIRQAC
jgi:hypothetical protein